MTINNAIKWLENHHITVIGSTSNGVCVVEELAKDGILYTQTVWLPANLNALHNWMGY